jgi:hypothetical protein
MRPEPTLVTGAAVLAAAVLFAATALISSDFALADASTAEEAAVRALAPDSFDWNDRVATLTALHHTLSEIDDGASFVWRRRDGQIAGVIRPTSSFLGTNGTVCRHVVVALATARRSRQVEGIACRNNLGGWDLDG